MINYMLNLITPLFLITYNTSGSVDVSGGPSAILWILIGLAIAMVAVLIIFLIIILIKKKRNGSKNEK